MTSVVGQNIRAIHECRTGIQTVWCCSIRKRNGELCVGSEEILCRWSKYCEGVLYVISSFEQIVLDDVDQLPSRSELLTGMRYWVLLDDLQWVRLVVSMVFCLMF